MTDNQVFKSCIRDALNDREAMMDSFRGDDCYSDSPYSAVVKEEINQISKLEKRRFSALKNHERRYAMLALLYAEQWESGYADSCKGSPESVASQKRADQFKELRHRIFGKTRYERDMEAASSVSIESLINQKF